MRLATRVDRILKDNSIPKSKELCANLQTWLENPRDADKCEVCYDNCCALLANEKKNHKELALLEEAIDVMPKLTQWVVGGGCRSWWFVCRTSFDRIGH